MPAGRILTADSIGALGIIPATAIMVAAAEALHMADMAAEILAGIPTAVHAEVLTDPARDVHLTALHGLDRER